MHTQVSENIKRIDLNSIKNKQINIAVFGHGNVGGNLIDQIIQARKNIKNRRNFDLNIFAIADSTSVLLELDGVQSDWRMQKQITGKEHTITEVISFAHRHNLKNLVLVDNTASLSFVEHYLTFVTSDFNIVSSNKIANTLSLKFYKELREKLTERKLHYLYETNVGAGLPLIDTIRLLHLSGENITRIRGVFSGSLSYLFNTFSEGEAAFSEVLNSAIEKGYTEPDPREDLCGNDVGRKLLILARELDLCNELEDVVIENLIPEELRIVSQAEFLTKVTVLDKVYEKIKKKLAPGEVLRYVADLKGDLSKDNGAILEVRLEKVSKNSMLGALTGSDSIFEIYTESYGNHPITIQGAGAGAAVTARGVFGDILRISEKSKG